MELLLTIHSVLRWLIVALGAAALLKFLIGWFGKTPFQPLDRGLMSGYAGSVDLNVTLGIVLLLWLGLSTGSWPAYRLEHALTMVVAAGVLHGSGRWRRNSPESDRFRNSFLIVLITLLIIVAGVSRVGGWS